MADPSWLLSREGLAWLEEDPETLGALIVPRTLVAWFDNEVDLDPFVLMAPEDAERFNSQRDRVESLVRRLPSFSHREVQLTPRSLEEVRNALIAEGGALGELHADEWAFLQSQSAMLSKLSRPIDAFRDAGAFIVEVGRKTGVRLLERVIPREHLPETVTSKVLAKAAAKWVVLGGAAVGGGTLGGIAGTVIGGAPGAFIGGKVGGFGAGAIADAALLAIDP
jgi:hypothetical protein